jgi:cytochrome o ubiquinol oxidase operon protein cyoD
MDASGLPVERSAKPYLVGLALAAVLTAIPFALVATHALPRFATLVVIAVAALLQIGVHLRFFLHIGVRSTPRENLVAMAFAAVLILFMVGGTLWIMVDLHYRMMM